MPTKDKLYISVNTFARWRVTDPLEYFRRLRDERSALSRIEDIIGSETRSAVAKHDLIEIIRTDKTRKPLRDEALEEMTENSPGNIGTLPAIRRGRHAIEADIRDDARAKLAELGIELLDVRFKRINYNSTVVEEIYERMISERLQIASKFRSEGQGQAARISVTRNGISIRSSPRPTRRSRPPGARLMRRHPRSTPVPTASGLRPLIFMNS